MVRCVKGYNKSNTMLSMTGNDVLYLIGIYPLHLMKSIKFNT